MYGGGIFPDQLQLNRLRGQPRTWSLTRSRRRQPVERNECIRICLGHQSFRPVDGEAVQLASAMLVKWQESYNTDP